MESFLGQGSTAPRAQVEGGTAPTLPRGGRFRPPAETVPPNAEEGIQFAQDVQNLPLPEEAGANLMSSGASSVRTIPTAQGTFLRTDVPERSALNNVFQIDRTGPSLGTAERAMPINVNESPYGVVDRMFQNIGNRWSQFQNNRAQQALQVERERVGGRVSEPAGIEMDTRGTAFYDRVARFQRGEISADQAASEIRQERLMARRGPRPFGEGETQESMTSRPNPALERQGAQIRENVLARNRGRMTEPTGEEMISRNPVSSGLEARPLTGVERADLRSGVRRRYRNFQEDYTQSTEATLDSRASTAAMRRQLGVDSPATTSEALASYQTGGRAISAVEGMGEEMGAVGGAEGAVESAATTAAEAVASEATVASELTTVAETVAELA